MSLDKHGLIRCDSSATFAPGVGVRSTAEHGHSAARPRRACGRAGRPWTQPAGRGCRLGPGCCWGSGRARRVALRPRLSRCPRGVPDDREIPGSLPRIQLRLPSLRHNTTVGRASDRRITVWNVAAPGAPSGESGFDTSICGRCWYAPQHPGWCCSETTHKD